MNCVFCDIVEGREPATFVRRWPGVIAIVPLNPVTEGHSLVIPFRHVRDALEVPAVTATTMRYAALLAKQMKAPGYNLITSAGAVATQTVFHLHIHVVPRREDDNLLLPWDTPAPVIPLPVAGGPGRT